VESWFNTEIKPVCLDRGVPKDHLDYTQGKMSDQVIRVFAEAYNKAVLVFQLEPYEETRYGPVQKDNPIKLLYKQSDAGGHVELIDLKENLTKYLTEIPTVCPKEVPQPKAASVAAAEQPT